MNNLRTIAVTLCLLTTVLCSATIRDTSRIIITSEQLRTTNLIFAEHAKYTKLVPLLQKENADLRHINDTWVKTDSIKTVQLYRQDELLLQQKHEIEHLDRNLKSSVAIGGTAVGISVAIVIICLLLK